MIITSLTQIVVAFLGFLCAALPAYFVFKAQLIKAKKLAATAIIERNEVIRKHLSSSFEINLNQLNEVRNIIHEVIYKTDVDRVLMLSSVNGKDPVNWISVIWEQHSDEAGCKLSIGATSKYMDISSDPEYKRMLRSIENEAAFVANVKAMPNCMLKDIYLNEDVKHALVVFGFRKKIDEANDQLIYFSWATHRDVEFNAALNIELVSATNRITNILN